MSHGAWPKDTRIHMSQFQDFRCPTAYTLFVHIIDRNTQVNVHVCMFTRLKDTSI
jgi:hypothetical protein